MIYFEKTASLMNDISTNEAPSLIQQLFTKAGNVHVTAQDRPPTGGNYYVKSSRLEIKKKLVFVFRHLCLEQFTSKITSCQ